jgi:hypothetical protein
MTNTDFSQGITGWELSGNVLINGSTVSVGGGCGANVNCYISQTFIANAGDTLSGNVQWFGGDYMPFNDYGSLLLIDHTNRTTSTIFYGDVNTYGNFGQSPLTNWNVLLSNSDSYRLELTSANYLDNTFSSTIKMSNLLYTSAALPEPASIAILAIGLIGFAASRRKKESNVTSSKPAAFYQDSRGLA